MKPWIDEPKFPKKELKLNKTDQSFEDVNPGYYTYVEEEYDPRICLVESCYKKFRTRLEMNKFCCREHQLSFLKGFATIGKFVKVKGARQS